MTPVSGAHFTVNCRANLHVQRFLTRSVQRQATWRRRDIDGSLILTRHNRNVLTFVGARGDRRIHRRLDGGVGNALRTGRSDHKVRLRRQRN